MESQVVAMASMHSSVIVNGNEKLYITSGADAFSSIYHDIDFEPQSTLKLIFSRPTTNRVLQISASTSHAAFVTKTGQVTISFMSLNYCFVPLS
jgi:hypothetical protein